MLECLVLLSETKYVRSTLSGNHLRKVNLPGGEVKTHRLRSADREQSNTPRLRSADQYMVRSILLQVAGGRQIAQVPMCHISISHARFRYVFCDYQI